MFTFTITIGLESPQLTPEECRQFALISAGKFFPEGHSIIDLTGRWLSPSRGIVDEPSLQIIVIGDDSIRENVLAFCNTYKAGCFQDCVLLQVSQPETHWL